MVFIEAIIRPTRNIKYMGNIYLIFTEPCNIKKLEIPLILYILIVGIIKKAEVCIRIVFFIFLFLKLCKIGLGQNIKVPLLAPAYCLYIFHCVLCECDIAWPIIIVVVFW
jgi:hypothetical protein